MEKDLKFSYLIFHMWVILCWTLAFDCVGQNVRNPLQSDQMTRCKIPNISIRGLLLTSHCPLVLQFFKNNAQLKCLQFYRVVQHRVVGPAVGNKAFSNWISCHYPACILCTEWCMRPLIWWLPPAPPKLTNWDRGDAHCRSSLTLSQEELIFL